MLWRSSLVLLSPSFLFWPSFSWPFYPSSIFFCIDLNTRQWYNATIPWDTGAASIPPWVYFNLWTLILARLYGSPCRVCTPHSEQGVRIKTEQSCLQSKELTCVRGDTVAARWCWEKLCQSQEPWLHQEQLWVSCSFWKVKIVSCLKCFQSCAILVAYSWQAVGFLSPLNHYGESTTSKGLEV